MDKVLRISHELIDRILNRQLTYIDSKYSTYEISDILDILDDSNEKTACKILIIGKNKPEKDTLNEMYRYYFIIYSTEEEERLLIQRLKALGYI